MEFPIELAGRVVAEQVVRAEIVGDASKRGGDVVGADDGSAVGAFSKTTEAVRSRSQPIVLLLRPQRRVELQAGIDGSGRDNAFVEHHEPARVDRIEGRVRSVGFVHDGPQPRLIVDVREGLPIELAFALRSIAHVVRVRRRELARAGIDADRRIARRRHRRVAVRVGQRAQ